jgi:hypothetical protein
MTRNGEATIHQKNGFLGSLHSARNPCHSARNTRGRVKTSEEGAQHHCSAFRCPPGRALPPTTPHARSRCRRIPRVNSLTDEHHVSCDKGMLEPLHVDPVWKLLVSSFFGCSFTGLSGFLDYELLGWDNT